MKRIIATSLLIALLLGRVVSGGHPRKADTVFYPATEIQAGQAPSPDLKYSVRVRSGVLSDLSFEICRITARGGSDAWQAVSGRWTGVNAYLWAPGRENTLLFSTAPPGMAGLWMWSPATGVRPLRRPANPRYDYIILQLYNRTTDSAYYCYARNYSRPGPARPGDRISTVLVARLPPAPKERLAPNANGAP